MNVPALDQTTVNPTPYVPTLKVPMYVAVLVAILAMVQIAQVNPGKLKLS